MSAHPVATTLPKPPPPVVAKAIKSPGAWRMWTGVGLAAGGAGLLLSERFVGRTSGMLVLSAGLWLCLQERGGE